jgi:hypothetical protein
MLTGHAREYALIHGDRVDSFWPDEDWAYDAACDRFAVEPFLVRRVEEKEPVLHTHLDVYPRCRP